MAHYAFLNSANIVTGVIVGADETDTSENWEEFYGNLHNCTVKRTSYNTYGNSHSLGGTPFRKNYAGIGYTYDTSKDAFIAPQPYASWTLNNTTCLWEPPIARPDGNYYWDEAAHQADTASPKTIGWVAFA